MSGGYLRGTQSSTLVSGSPPVRLSRLMPCRTAIWSASSSKPKTSRFCRSLVGSRRLGDGNGTDLVVPPEDHLRRGAAVRRGDCGDIRIVEHLRVGAERAVRLGHDAALVVPCAELRLVELRVQLDLVHGGPDARALDDLVDLGGGEVRDPNRPRLPLRAQVDQRLPRLDVPADRRQRPVDEVQVDVVEAKAGQALVEPGEGLAASVLRTRELGGHEELLARQPRRGDRPPHAGLVAVRCRGVDEPVSGPECVADGRERLVVVHGPRAQAELGNRVTVRHGPRWRKRGFEHRSLLRAYRSRAQPSHE